MDKRKIWRWFFTPLSVVGLVVMAINIERLVEFFGVDKLLVNLASKVPDWLSGLWDIATSHTVLVLSAVVVAYTAGMWTETYFRRIALGRNKPFDLQQFANYCEETAEIIDANLKFLRGEHDFTVSILAKLRNIEEIFRRKLNIIVRLDKRSKLGWEDTAILLVELAAPIRRGDLDATRAVIDGLKPAAPEHQSPQDTETETPPKIPHDFLQDQSWAGEKTS